MGFFVFIGIVVGLLVALLGLRTLTSKREPATPLVRINIAAGEDEARLWQRTLAQAQIWSRIIAGTSEAHPVGFQHELWVQAKDAERAREALGLDE